MKEINNGPQFSYNQTDLVKMAKLILSPFPLNLVRFLRRACPAAGVAALSRGTSVRGKLEKEGSLSS